MREGLGRSLGLLSGGGGVGSESGPTPGRGTEPAVGKGGGGVGWFLGLSVFNFFNFFNFFNLFNFPMGTEKETCYRPAWRAM